MEILVVVLKVFGIACDSKTVATVAKALSMGKSIGRPKKAIAQIAMIDKKIATTLIKFPRRRFIHSILTQKTRWTIN